MTDLREELTSTLRAFEPSHPPVADTMRLGRAIRTRRRLAVTAGALAVIAAVVGYPTLAHQLAAPGPAPAQHRHDPVVTAIPPARGSAAGTVAEGSIGSTRWAVTLRSEAPPASLCVSVVMDAAAIPGATGAASATSAPFGSFCGVSPGSGQDPASFTSAAQSGIVVELGSVAPDVTYFVLTFADGQQLKLIPVTVYGHRYVAFAAPLDMPVASVTAHLGSAHFDSGQTATAIPFNSPGVGPNFVKWLRPGQPALPRVTATIGSGTVDGATWTATAYQGPWGTCIVDTGGSYCTPLALTDTGANGWGGSPMVVTGGAAANVAYLEITMSDGTVLPKVTPVRVGGQRLFAFAVPQRAKQPGHWTAYSASGARLSSGTFGR